MRFHHIGYAVADIPDYIEGVLNPVFGGSAVSQSWDDPIQQVRVCFVEMPNAAFPFPGSADQAGRTLIELVQPLSEDSPIHKIIGSQRGGVYHLCYEVDDLDATMKSLRKQRFLPLGKPVPAVAFEGRRIVFLMTPQRDLIELLEAA